MDELAREEDVEEEMPEPPDLKPRLTSSTLWMTVVMVSVLVTNSILKARGHDAIEVSPDIAMGLAVALSGLYVYLRQKGRQKVNDKKAEIAVAKAESAAKVAEAAAKVAEATAAVAVAKAEVETAKVVAGSQKPEETT